MYYWIVAITPCSHSPVAKCTVVRALRLMPTAHIPNPTIIHHGSTGPVSYPTNLWATILDAGLTSALFIVIMLALIVVIAGVIWMFRTRRWQLASFPVINAKHKHNRRQLFQQMDEAMVTRTVPSPRVREQIQVRETPGQEALPVFSSEEDSPTNQTDISQKPESLLKNKRWLGMAEECAELFDELDRLFPRTDPRWEVATHVKNRLAEILTRSGVEFISQDRTYDIHRHTLIPSNPVAAPGTPIKKIISPGFAIGQRVLRPARVQVALTTEVSTGEERKDG